MNVLKDTGGRRRPVPILSFEAQRLCLREANPGEEPGWEGWVKGFSLGMTVVDSKSEEAGS